jgi:hypothetical protein
LALGSVTVATPVSCANENGADLGAPNGTCYDLTISCPNVADEAMGVKLNTPTGTSKGTVLFTTGGGGGPNWYDQNFTYGTLAVQDVVNGGFTTAQLNFWENPTGFPTGGHFAGWLTGPGGPLALACRWATAAQWVHDNIANNTAFCATGNSGGSGAAAYAISHYGMGPVFNFLEETSGPPYARIDKGCTCEADFVMTTPCSNGIQFSECYQMDGNLYIDPAYSPTGDECSSAEASHSTTNDPTFLDDSIMGSNPLLSYPNTDIHFVFGDLDTGSADPQAMEWINMITAKNGVPTVSCVADAPHMIADVQDGATTIANDIIASCHQ